MKRVLASLILLILLACTEKASNDKPQRSSATSNSLFGQFANSDFADRGKGYDYVAVDIDSLNEYFALVNISSRADKKRPSCEVQIIARIADGILAFESVDKNTIEIRSTSDGIRIQAVDDAHQGDLSFYCSGGASIAGDYTQVNLESVPKEELSFLEFGTESHTLQGINFRVQYTSNYIFNQLLVSPSGLAASNRPEVWPIEGQVERTEIEDLNSDGWPEILSFIRSTEGKVSAVGYSVNSGESMSMIYLPELTNDEAAMYGYEGNEEVSIVETSVIRRFPISENDGATKKYRQLQYQLIDGEAARVFKLNKVTEY